MNQLRNLRFNALAILIVLAVIDLIIAFEAGRRFERKKPLPVALPVEVVRFNI